MRTRLSIAGLALGLIGLIALAGCGSSSSSTTAEGTTAAETTTGSSGGAATIDVADNPKLGQVLVDSQGHTVYMFEKDESDESYCNGKCAKVWPPYTTKGDPKAGKGAEASKLGTLKRDDGSTQVTYDGAPLYLYVSDKKPGDATGNELDQFGAEWYALRPSGDKAESDEAAGGGSGGDEAGGGGGGGSGYSSY
jgi:predicted lipoprotein with Yx(FWY)xxD motif